MDQPHGAGQPGRLGFVGYCVSVVAAILGAWKYAATKEPSLAVDSLNGTIPVAHPPFTPSAPPTVAIITLPKRTPNIRLASGTEVNGGALPTWAVPVNWMQVYLLLWPLWPVWGHRIAARLAAVALSAAPLWLATNLESALPTISWTVATQTLPRVLGLATDCGDATVSVGSMALQLVYSVLVHYATAASTEMARARFNPVSAFLRAGKDKHTIFTQQHTIHHLSSENNTLKNDLERKLTEQEQRIRLECQIEIRDRQLEDQTSIVALKQKRIHDRKALEDLRLVSDAQQANSAGQDKTTVELQKRVAELEQNLDVEVKHRRKNRTQLDTALQQNREKDATILKQQCTINAHEREDHDMAARRKKYDDFEAEKEGLLTELDRLEAADRCAKDTTQFLELDNAELEEQLAFSQKRKDAAIIRAENAEARTDALTKENVRLREREKLAWRRYEASEQDLVKSVRINKFHLGFTPSLETIERKEREEREEREALEAQSIAPLQSITPGNNSNAADTSALESQIAGLKDQLEAANKANATTGATLRSVQENEKTAREDAARFGMSLGDEQLKNEQLTKQLDDIKKSSDSLATQLEQSHAEIQQLSTAAAQAPAVVPTSETPEAVRRERDEAETALATLFNDIVVPHNANVKLESCEQVKTLVRQQYELVASQRDNISNEKRHSDTELDRVKADLANVNTALELKTRQCNEANGSLYEADKRATRLRDGLEDLKDRSEAAENALNLRESGITTLRPGKVLHALKPGKDDLDDVENDDALLEAALTNLGRYMVSEMQLRLMQESLKALRCSFFTPALLETFKQQEIKIPVDLESCSQRLNVQLLGKQIASQAQAKVVEAGMEALYVSEQLMLKPTEEVKNLTADKVKKTVVEPVANGEILHHSGTPPASGEPASGLVSGEDFDMIDRNQQDAPSESTTSVADNWAATHRDAEFFRQAVTAFTTLYQAILDRSQRVLRGETCSPEESLKEVSRILVTLKVESNKDDALLVKLLMPLRDIMVYIIQRRMTADKLDEVIRTLNGPLPKFDLEADVQARPAPEPATKIANCMTNDLFGPTLTDIARTEIEKHGRRLRHRFEFIQPALPAIPRLHVIREAQFRIADGILQGYFAKTGMIPDMTPALEGQAWTQAGIWTPHEEQNVHNNWQNFAASMIDTNGLPQDLAQYLRKQVSGYTKYVFVMSRNAQLHLLEVPKTLAEAPFKLQATFKKAVPAIASNMQAPKPPGPSTNGNTDNNGSKAASPEVAAGGGSAVDDPAQAQPPASNPTPVDGPPTPDSSAAIDPNLQPSMPQPPPPSSTFNFSGVSTQDFSGPVGNSAPKPRRLLKAPGAGRRR